MAPFNADDNHVSLGVNDLRLDGARAVANSSNLCQFQSEKCAKVFRFVSRKMWFVLVCGCKVLHVQHVTVALHHHTHMRDATPGTHCCYNYAHGFYNILL